MAGERLLRAHELRRQGESHLASAGWLTARELLGDALALYRSEREPGGEAACLRGLGEVARKLGETARARELIRQARGMAQAAGDALGEAESLYRQAEIHRTEGDGAAAREAFLEAANLFAGEGHRQGQARCLGMLGEIGRESGEPPETVLALYRQAHRLQVEVGDLRGAAVTLVLIAGFLRDRDPVGAAETFLQAARIYDGLGVPHRADPLYGAARRLDPAREAPARERPRSPWEDEDPVGEPGAPG